MKKPSALFLCSVARSFVSRLLLSKQKRGYCSRGSNQLPSHPTEQRKDWDAVNSSGSVSPTLTGNKAQSQIALLMCSGFPDSSLMLHS